MRQYGGPSRLSRYSYGTIELHPGVIFLVPAVRRPAQVQLFETALVHIEAHPDMVNRALDVTFDLSGQIVLISYYLP